MNHNPMKLTIEKTILYSHGGGPAYRASVNGDAIAVAKRKPEAEEMAIKELYSAYAIQCNPPAIAVLSDGRIMVGVELNLESFALYYFRADGGREQQSAICQRSINGEKCSLREFVQYNALMHDGMDCLEAHRVMKAEMLKAREL